MNDAGANEIASGQLSIEPYRISVDAPGPGDIALVGAKSVISLAPAKVCSYY